MNVQPARVSAVVLALLVLGCGGPFLVFPGGRLSGQVVTDPPDDWSFVDSTSWTSSYRRTIPTR